MRPLQTIENLPVSANLRSLFLGKNKITKIEGLDGLTGLRTLSIQSASPLTSSLFPRLEHDELTPRHASQATA